MKVLLIQDVPGLGQKFDLMEVVSHYFDYHLLPNRKALVWTRTVQKRYQDVKINDRTSSTPA